MTTKAENIEDVTPAQEDPLAKLERRYIEVYLRTQGYSWKDLCTLPEDLAKHLMIEACKFASNKLAEMEARSNLIHEIHGEF